MQFEFVSFHGAVMPDIHDEEKCGSNDKWNPPSLIDLEEDCREVSELHQEGESSEEEDEDPMASPYQ